MSVSVLPRWTVKSTTEHGLGPALDALRKAAADADAEVQAAEQRLAATPPTLPRARYQASYLFDLAAERAALAREAYETAMKARREEARAAEREQVRAELRPLLEALDAALSEASRANAAVLAVCVRASERGIDLGQLWWTELVQTMADPRLTVWRQSLKERGLL